MEAHPVVRRRGPYSVTDGGEVVTITRWSQFNSLPP
jgi:hypothetical protein